MIHSHILWNDQTIWTSLNKALCLPSHLRILVFPFLVALQFQYSYYWIESATLIAAETQHAITEFCNNLTTRRSGRHWLCCCFIQVLPPHGIAWGEQKLKEKHRRWIVIGYLRLLDLCVRRTEAKGEEQEVNTE